MRKYISILAVALAALFVATSCEFSSGTDPDTNKANRLLWNRVQEALGSQYHHIVAVAQLNDTLRKAEYGNKPYKGEVPEITESNGVYTLVYAYERTYIVNTLGKKLEEGGEWSIQVKYGTYMEPYKLGTVKGVVGEPTKFSFDFADMYAYRGPYPCALKSEVEYFYNVSDESLDITLFNTEGHSVEHYAEDHPDYIIEFKAPEPLVFYGGELYSGVVDILYKDNVSQTQRGVTVEISNKFTTFAPPKLE